MALPSPSYARPLAAGLVRASTDLCSPALARPSPRSLSTGSLIPSSSSPRPVPRATPRRPPLAMAQSTSASTTFASASHPPVFQTVAQFRQWRQARMMAGESVGFVPTMGALHDGHLDLVRHSLAENDHTVVSIFVNPAQFAPTEDFSSYPRTLPTDLARLEELRGPSLHAKGVSAIFAPTVPEMYPSPIPGEVFTQHVERQKGAFVYVKGLEDEMEGKSRPGFFRGVATVVTKLFHVVQPDLAYFGQKDIQQAVILRRLASDLLFSHPPGASALRIIPTTRDAKDGLALSSRNAYLTPKAREYAPALWEALNEGKRVWEATATRASDSQARVDEVLTAARSRLEALAQRAKREGDIDIEPLYISLNHPVSLEDLERQRAGPGGAPDLERGAILSGAAMIWDGEGGRKTRLIDNLLLGFAL